MYVYYLMIWCPEQCPVEKKQWRVCKEKGKNILSPKRVNTSRYNDKVKRKDHVLSL